MIDVKFKLEDTSFRIVKAADKAAFKNFSHAAAGVRKTAQASIVQAPKEQRRKAKKVKSKKTGQKVFVSRGGHKASPPGSPPYTRRGQYKRAIVFDASKTGAVIGPRASVIGQSGVAHEHGGLYEGEQYPQRATMGPALSENLSRFHKTWAGSIGGNN